MAIFYEGSEEFRKGENNSIKPSHFAFSAITKTISAIAESLKVVPEMKSAIPKTIFAIPKNKSGVPKMNFAIPKNKK